MRVGRPVGTLELTHPAFDAAMRRVCARRTHIQRPPRLDAFFTRPSLPEFTRYES